MIAPGDHVERTVPRPIVGAKMLGLAVIFSLGLHGLVLAWFSHWWFSEVNFQYGPRWPGLMVELVAPLELEAAAPGEPPPPVVYRPLPRGLDYARLYPPAALEVKLTVEKKPPRRGLKTGGLKPDRLAGLAAAEPDYPAEGRWIAEPPLPRYPEAARLGRQEGRVVLTVTVWPDGRVGAAAVAESSGHRRLDVAALNAARLLVFRRQGPAATEAVNYIVTYEFKLHHNWPG